MEAAQPCRHGVAVAAGVLVLGLWAPLGGARADEVALAPHRAAYELRLTGTEAESDVTDAYGAMTLEWTRTCDGWALSQKLRVIITPEESPRLDSEISFSSFESDDGLRYRFSSRTLRNGREVEAFRGRAERPTAGAPATARYELPEGGEVALSPDVVFPMQHTRELLAVARRGEAPSRASSTGRGRRTARSRPTC